VVEELGVPFSVIGHPPLHVDRPVSRVAESSGDSQKRLGGLPSCVRNHPLGVGRVKICVHELDRLKIVALSLLVDSVENRGQLEHLVKGFGRGVTKVDNDKVLVEVVGRDVLLVQSFEFFVGCHSREC